jgi:hypothetical protein
MDFVVCVKNDGYEVSLEQRKIYRVLPDDQAATHRMLRVIDESDEDYLYPADFFASISLPQRLVEVLALAA